MWFFRGIAAISAVGFATLCRSFVPHSLHRRHATVKLAVVKDPTFVPPDTSTIDEIACKETAARMERILVPVSDDVSQNGKVGISFVHWPAVGKRTTSIPLVLIHGFDSSALEYRRLGCRLAERGVDVYAVDLLGWGYTQLENVESFSAAAKIEALKSWTNEVFGDGEAYAVAGASLGGASAIEIAASSPDTVQGLILIDAQGFVDGVGPMAKLPTVLAKAGVSVLKSVPLRSSANQMSYYDKETFATEDALRVGRLHCLQDGWDDALVSFMQSGGFSPSSKVATIQTPSLVLWGRQDGILDGDEFANKFVETIPDAELLWIEECGHVPHLEKPDETAEAIASFLASQSSASPADIPFVAVAATATALAGAAAIASQQLL